MTDVPAASGRATTTDDPTRLTARLAEAQDQLAASSEVLSVLARASSSEEDVFQAVVHNARRLCDADVAQISLAEGDGYRLASFIGHDPDYVAFAVEHPVPGNRSTLIGRVALDRTTRQIDDVLADPDYNLPEYQRRGRYRSIIGAPMVVDDEVVGVLTVWRTEVRPFDDHVAQLLTTFAAQAALAVRTGQLFSALQEQRAGLTRKVEEMQALAEIGTAISSLTLEHHEVLTMIVEHAVSLAGADGGSLMDYDEATRLFRVRAAWGTQPDVLHRLQSVRIHLDETLVGRAARSGTPVQVQDLTLAERDPHLDILHAAGWRSLVAVPLTRPDRIVGVLVVRRLSTGAFSDETTEMLTAFAVQSAVALTNVRLYQQLEQQRRELEETSQHKSEFLASMSHELRTPLNAVIGFSEVLLERMFGDLNERQAEYVGDIHDAGRHLLDLLNDVLDLSKVEAGRMEIELSTFPLADAVHGVLSLLRERAQRAGLELVSDLSTVPGLVRADELRFKQVLLNLVGNAVKFTPAGGSVTVAATLEGPDLVLTVSDTGVGIAQDDQERIFDSFQQGSRSTSQVEGTGLGLTLTRRIVELHGGRVWLTSEVGVGSTFGVTFPNQPGDQHPAPAPATYEPSVEDARPTVVVIEDDPSSSELVQLHLGAAGLRPVPVPSGEEGLAAVRALRPTAVVLDIHLPGMDGWDVLAAIKGDPSLAETPVVVVSVLPERGRGFALGAADYLVKPVGRDELLGAVWRAVADGADHGSAHPGGVVVIDDDPVALALIRATLEPHGWTVTTTDRGADALDVVRAASPSVVLVDLLMPGVDGFAVVDMLRADPEHAATPVVVLTSKSLTARDRERLRGRIEFVASKGALELDWLAGRLSQVAQVGRRGEGGGG
ncbi:GAF domain-containing protein [Oryzobacter telluris]|uniref:GAF domain-containing protein n=1 Tax=Oryzobacter telluris TaxID=3149179 RepID=UPI00370DA0DE